MVANTFSLAVVLCTVGLLAGPPPPILTCKAVSLARPGNGVQYRGNVSNGDYRFSATVPAGLAGWGAGSDAPFHGFTIFLADQAVGNSCIVFRIGMRVELPEDAVSEST